MISYFIRFFQNITQKFEFISKHALFGLTQRKNTHSRNKLKFLSNILKKSYKI